MPRKMRNRPESMTIADHVQWLKHGKGVRPQTYSALVAVAFMAAGYRVCQLRNFSVLSWPLDPSVTNEEVFAQFTAAEQLANDWFIVKE